MPRVSLLLPTAILIVTWTCSYTKTLFHYFFHYTLSNSTRLLFDIAENLRSYQETSVHVLVFRIVEFLSIVPAEFMHICFIVFTDLSHGADAIIVGDS